jgi:hypothetical protein
VFLGQCFLRGPRVRLQNTNTTVHYSRHTIDHSMCRFGFGLERMRDPTIQCSSDSISSYSGLGFWLRTPFLGSCGLEQYSTGQRGGSWRAQAFRKFAGPWVHYFAAACFWVTLCGSHCEHAVHYSPGHRISVPPCSDDVSMNARLLLAAARNSILQLRWPAGRSRGKEEVGAFNFGLFSHQVPERYRKH